jgi:hypothetical protein
MGLFVEGCKEDDPSGMISLKCRTGKMRAAKI